jgi:hypothetical protein
MAAEAKENTREVVNGWLAIPATVLGILLALFALHDRTTQSPAWRQIIEGQWLWAAYAVLVLAVVIWLARVWRLKVVIRPVRRDRAIWQTLMWVTALLVAGILFAAHGPHTDSIAEAIFPEAELLGGALTRSWGSNGKAKFALEEGSDPYAPPEYVRITFQNFGSTADYSCGWALFFLRGVDISDRSKLRFRMRGEQGGEKIGIKAKDIRGFEGSLPPADLPSITKEWQLVEISLSDFPTVTFSAFDNFSLYTNGALSSTRPQTILLGGIELIKRNDAR